jgi:hypothetical protein
MVGYGICLCKIGIVFVAVIRNKIQIKNSEELPFIHVCKIFVFNFGLASRYISSKHFLLTYFENAVTF